VGSARRRGGALDDRRAGGGPLSRRALAAIGALALLGAALYAWRARGARFAPEAAEVATLRRQLEQLQQEFEELTAQAPDQAFASAPSDGLVVGVPTSVASEMARQIVAGYLANVRLTLRDKRVKTKSEDVEAKVLFARRTVGSYLLQTRVVSASAVLRPRELELSFEEQRLRFRLPVSVSEGRGRVQLGFAWDSKGIADLVCGDLEVTRELNGRLIPAVYPMSGHFELAAEHGALLLRPHFTQSSIRVRIEASDEAWLAFDELVDERSGLCQRAVEKADVKRRLAAVLAEGFDVRLPRRMLRDITLPASVQESLKLADGSYTLKAAPAHVAMNARWLWYGTSVTIERASAGGEPGG
jgi:hypothetical protein